MTLSKSPSTLCAVEEIQKSARREHNDIGERTICSPQHWTPKVRVHQVPDEIENHTLSGSQIAATYWEHGDGHLECVTSLSFTGWWQHKKMGLKIFLFCTSRTSPISTHGSHSLELSTFGTELAFTKMNEELRALVGTSDCWDWCARNVVLGDSHVYVFGEAFASVMLCRSGKDEMLTRPSSLYRLKNASPPQSSSEPFYYHKGLFLKFVILKLKVANGVEDKEEDPIDLNPEPVDESESEDEDESEDEEAGKRTKANRKERKNKEDLELFHVCVSRQQFAPTVPMTKA
ncbi:hypothetical protein SELMODRAFT_406028 [Selaginella moellendorffii]|uniref:Uncharacterized protein n=1 Tax=Selaginella moellendorffii TaxID=88036 RepID=D8R0F4_SELML|nr:hypothetical protein SELMODRAFT_406028 [Selaginella moellendorffii]